MAQYAELLPEGFDATDFAFPKQDAAAKLDSQLASMVRDLDRQPREAIADRAPVSSGSSVAVTIRTSGDIESLLNELESHDIVIANQSSDVLEAFVPVTQLQWLDRHSAIDSVSLIVPPASHVTSHAVNVHGASSWHTQGYAGHGVKVGIIDLGFENLSALMGTELPGSIRGRCYTGIGQYSDALSACENGEIHGAAVAEAVHDIAPGAELFVSNPLSLLDLRESAQWMVSQGVTVINYSAGWEWDGPGDGTSPYTESPLKTVEMVTNAGVTWINSAGNSGLDTWFGSFSDTDGDSFHNFSPDYDFNLTGAFAGDRVVIQMRWDASWGGASSDLSLTVADPNVVPIAVSDNVQMGRDSDVPFEDVSFIAPSTGFYGIFVTSVSGSLPAWIQLQVFIGDELTLTSPGYAITNPAESQSAGLLAVGAANWGAAGTIESFSSQGPTPDGRIKPDITGVDFVDSVAYGSPFPGTSQASPHVAGLAALVKQRFPHYTPAEVANYLKSNAQARGSVPNNTWGYGLAYLPEVTGTDPTPTPEPPAGEPIERTWQRTDKPVQDGAVNRTWMWGPEPFEETTEPYVESPGDQRAVVYYDKSRMEINDPVANQNDPWYVTNGLLVVELVSGNMQTGDSEHQPRWPAVVNVAGDANDPTGPTYATFNPLRSAAPAATGALITQRVDRSGGVWNDGSLAGYGVAAGPYISETKHTVAGPFWTFMNSSGLVYENGGFTTENLFENPFYATGFPITEAYWANVKVGGVYQDVLMQCFERRCLTYTPGNDAGWQVEAGNVGQHYYTWRYTDTGPVTPTPTATSTATPTATATPTQPAPTPTATEPGDGTPVEGAVVFQPDLSAFEPYTSADGKVRAYWDPTTSSYVIEDSTVVGGTPSGMHTWWATSLDVPSSYSVTVDVVTLTGDTTDDSTASLFYRLESNEQGATEFTSTDLTTSGWIGSYYVRPDEFVPLADFSQPAAFNAGYGAVNQMKAVVRGDHAWVYLNGALIHDFMIDSRNSQQANGFAFALQRTGNAAQVSRFGFRNLVIREVQ